MKPRLAPLAVTLMLVALAALQMAPAGVATSPQACFTAPSAAGVGQTVNVDASCSTNTFHVPAGLTYRWDFNYPSSYGPSSSSPFESYVYNAPGTYTIRLEVTDAANNNIATTSQTIVIGPSNYAPAWGWIYLYHDGTILVTDNSYQYLGWTCTTLLLPHPQVQCVAPSPPPGYMGWACPGIALTAAAVNVGSSVNGEFECLDGNALSSSVSTGDLYGPNAWAWTSTPVVNDVVSVTCHARPTFANLAPQPVYYVVCGDP